MRFAVSRTILAALVALLLVNGCAAEEKAATQPSDRPRLTTDVAEALAESRVAGEQPVLPFLRVNMKQRYVDLDGRIVLREGPLELVACVANTKEHESIVLLKSRPQHIHLALLMLGMQPGRPGTWEYGEKEVIVKDATGPKIQVTLRYAEGRDKIVERPINEFVRADTDEEEAAKVLPNNVFIFAGSQVAELPDDRKVYGADLSGNVISLVTFADDLLAWPDAASTENAALMWEANTPAIPPLETPVVVRLRPVPPAEDNVNPGDAGADAGSRDQAGNAGDATSR